MPSMAVLVTPDGTLGRAWKRRTPVAWRDRATGIQI